MVRRRHSTNLWGREVKYCALRYLVLVCSIVRTPIKGADMPHTNYEGIKLDASLDDQVRKLGKR